MCHAETTDRGASVLSELTSQKQTKEKEGDRGDGWTEYKMNEMTVAFEL